MNPSSNDGRTPTGSSKSGSTTKPEQIEMSESAGSHDGHGQSSSGLSSGAAASTGTTTNQTGEKMQMTVFASRATSTSNVTAQNSDSGSGDVAAATFPDSSGSTGSNSHEPRPAAITSIWHRITFWWTTRSAMTKIAICSVLSLLLSLFMIWAIWHLVSTQKDGETTSTTALPFTTTAQQEISELSSTLSPVEPIEDITTDSPIWPEFTLPPDLPTEFETISVITKGEALPQSSQSVEDTSSTQGQLSKVTPQESSTITAPSTRAAPPKPTVPSTFAIDEQMTTKLPEKEKSTFPEEETVTPYVEPTFPDEETVTPYKEITLPQETSTSHVVHTSPSSEHTSIRHELSTKPQTSPESTKVKVST